MNAWIYAPVDRLIEPTPAPEIFTDGVGAIEMIGQNCRIAYYATQRLIDAAQSHEQRVVVTKLIIPMLAMTQAVQILSQCSVPLFAQDLSKFRTLM